MSFKERFTYVYENKVWGEGSGGGSNIENNGQYVELLQNFLKENEIKSVVDFGCGDWQISQHIDWTGINYTGIDCVDSVVISNIERFLSNHVTFFVSTNTRKLKADLLIIKDVLQHWTDEEIVSFLEDNKSRFKYILITNSTRTDHWQHESQKDIITRPISRLDYPLSNYECELVTRLTENPHDPKEVLLINNMTQKEYIEQNAKGFEGDSYLREKVQSIIKEKKIYWVIETGTYRGATTKHLAEGVAKVDTIEIMEDNFQIAASHLSGTANIELHKGNSPEELDKLFTAFNKKGRRPNLLCFLDAHWGEYNPLLDELKTIAKHKWKPVIIIHDFKVPGRDDLGFDTYKDIVYEWDWIKNDIDKIYGAEGYTVEYNDKAEGAKRGVIFIYPKK